MAQSCLLPKIVHPDVWSSSDIRTTTSSAHTHTHTHTQYRRWAQSLVPKAFSPRTQREGSSLIRGGFFQPPPHTHTHTRTPAPPFLGHWKQRCARSLHCTLLPSLTHVKENVIHKRTDGSTFWRFTPRRGLHVTENRGQHCERDPHSVDE